MHDRLHMLTTLYRIYVGNPACLSIYLVAFPYQFARDFSGQAIPESFFVVLSKLRDNQNFALSNQE